MSKNPENLLDFLCQEDYLSAEEAVTKIISNDIKIERELLLYVDRFYIKYLQSQHTWMRLPPSYLMDLVTQFCLEVRNGLYAKNGDNSDRMKLCGGIAIVFWKHYSDELRRIEKLMIPIIPPGLL